MTPLLIKRVQAEKIAKRMSKSCISGVTRCLKTIIKWGVSEMLLPPPRLRGRMDRQAPPPRECPPARPRRNLAFPRVLERDGSLPRTLEPTCTAWDLQSFAEDCGESGPPFIWDPARRFQVRCESETAFFHLYGISRDDTDYILDTFPIVRKHDEKAHGEYRTKHVILEICDALAETTPSDKPYVWPLEPPRRAT